MRNLAFLTVAGESGGQAVLSAITTVGFPIVMCLIFCMYIKSINEKHSKEIKDFVDSIKSINETHAKETKDFVESINNNTLVLQKLCDRLDADGR